MKVSRKQSVKAKSPSRPVSETARLLREARAVIRLKKNWCKWAQGRTINGDKVLGYDPAAVQWCAFGAVVKVADSYTQAAYIVDKSLNPAAHRMGYEFAAELNNSTDHKTTLKMFTLAAKLAEQEDRAKSKSPLKEKGRDNHAK